VTGDEDDRHVGPIGGDTLLQVETIEVRKTNVQYQAARSKNSLDLRITLETDDQALIYMTFQGLRHGSYFRTLPRFETSAEPYAFLNRIVSVGVGEARLDGAVHQIAEIL